MGGWVGGYGADGRMDRLRRRADAPMRREADRLRHAAVPLSAAVSPRQGAGQFRSRASRASRVRDQLSSLSGALWLNPPANSRLT